MLFPPLSYLPAKSHGSPGRPVPPHSTRPPSLSSDHFIGSRAPERRRTLESSRQLLGSVAESHWVSSSSATCRHTTMLTGRGWGCGRTQEAETAGALLSPP
ncbi:unnamed protein product [Pleuronectes platessa]|uniref:Uncharacterized protein n=1 Tax=Pleuronectes platessa TaxID=8262 RepID=A0A9N7UAV2_PLEPL|nr:unnamed protein product [Pleuronectes platessa]